MAGWLAGCLGQLPPPSCYLYIAHKFLVECVWEALVVSLLIPGGRCLPDLRGAVHAATWAHASRLHPTTGVYMTSGSCPRII